MDTKAPSLNSHPSAPANPDSSDLNLRHSLNEKQRNFLIQMSGAPGSGKSTTAHLLAKAIDKMTGHSAVVINHDLIKSFFLTTFPAITTTPTSFDDSAKLAYRLDFMLAEDMMASQGKTTVVIDSVCNYRECIDSGLATVRKFSEKGWEYKYLECRVEDVALLDGRLRDRAGAGSAMPSQRTAVGQRPAASSSGDRDCGENSQALFEKWIRSPARPAEEDGAQVLVVDSKTQTPEECVTYVLKELGLL
ncbi:hypothetical protein B0H66DRAFT_569342 [Apodospora peruviana]|uniref:Zeta toxin domain-containing protein n=1 Tax=Apodospora peruviana TaxID=516989 RepID=A0AAE0HU85_9PEZI|nr:hypothetical protein B0H66DRAFT_569342 [Apodospora peruviana]